MVRLSASERFEAFTFEHFLLIGLCLAGCVLVVRWGRSHRGTTDETALRRRFAVTIAAVALAVQVYLLTPGEYDRGTSLPLALCDLATIAAVIALWSRDPRAAAFTYYVGLTLTMQGVLTPSLGQSFPHPRYLGFWALHLLVVWAACYLVWGLGLRPNWRRYAFAVATTLAWAVTVYCFNLAFDTNYGYLNAKPSAASLFDLMGPWPVYLFVAGAVVSAGWAVLLTLPWYVVAPHGRPADSGQASRSRCST